MSRQDDLQRLIANRSHANRTACDNEEADRCSLVRDTRVDQNGGRAKSLFPQASSASFYFVFSYKTPAPSFALQH